MSVPHVQRCTEVRTFGTGGHRRAWQCLISPAPHPDRPCAFGVDAEVYGRVLDEQPAVWLAAHLRAAQAQLTYERNRVAELTRHAARMARVAAEPDHERDVPADTRAWVIANLPVAAFTLGWTDATRRPT